MPLVRGGSVASHQTLQALEAVHAAGIVHRDIKPANLLLEPTGRGQPHLRLTDFGIAAPIDEPRMTRASMAIGSPGYMPPEQWHGADPDPRQDIYSVGLVGLEMLTGIRPEVERAPIDLDALPEPRQLARELVAVLERAASPDPAARHASAIELRRDLTRLDLVDQTMATDDDIEVFDHFPASAPAPGDRTPTRQGLPHPAPEQTDRYAAATVLGTASATAVQPPSRAQSKDGGKRSLVPGLILVIVGLVSIVLAIVVALGG
jgi:serine/threonine-protein kinase